MTIYISGPLSLGGTATQAQMDLYIRAFEEAHRQLLIRRHHVRNPIHITPQGKRWEDYMRVALQWVCLADGMLLLPDWHLSKGAIAEVQVAHWTDTPIYLSLDSIPAV